MTAGPRAVFGRRFVLSTTERRALRAHLARIPQFARDASYAAFVADLIAGAIESVRCARLADALLLAPGEALIEEPRGVRVVVDREVVRAVQSLTPQAVARAPRGRPRREAARIELAKTIFACFRPATAALTEREHARRGSPFEELVAFAYELAGIRVATVHRDCIAATKKLRIERA